MNEEVNHIPAKAMEFYLIYIHDIGASEVGTHEHKLTIAHESLVSH